MEYENLLYEVDGGVVILTINRPEQLNALNSAVIKELRTALARFHDASDQYVLILTGSGEKAFVAGADIKEMSEMSEAQAFSVSQAGQAVTRALGEGDKISIAAVNGFALGGGCELALACDWIVASERARLGQPEVTLGVIPGFGGTQRLARRVGKARAKYLVCTGDIVKAPEALSIGLVDKVVEAGTTLEVARKMARKMVVSCSVHAIKESKRVIEQGRPVPLPEALHLEATAFAASFTTADQTEGMEAFIDKRAPKFDQ